MNIEDKINKYLGEKREFDKIPKVNKKQAIDKITKAIKSAKKIDQLESVIKMIKSFDKNLDKGFLDKDVRKLTKIATDQAKRIKHLDKNVDISKFIYNIGAMTTGINLSKL